MNEEKDFPQGKSENKTSIKEINEIINNSKNKKQQTNLKKKLISSRLSKFNSEEKNSYLDILIKDLAFYKGQKSEGLSRNEMKTNIPSKDNVVYNFIEKHLMEISYISNKETREERIKKVYDWYKEKLKYDKDLGTINYKSYKDKNEVDEKEYSLMQPKIKFKTIDLEKNHRNLELINKKMLKEYERKKLTKPFWALKKAISSQLLSHQRNNTMTTITNLTGINFDKPDMTSLYTTTKATNIPTKKNFLSDTASFIDKPDGGLLEKDYNGTNLSNFMDNIFLPPVNRETKYSYSYLRPIYDLNAIYLENQIIKEKNKLLSFKREQEEIQKKLKEFSLFRAKFRENLNNKFELKNMLNYLVNKDNLSSFMLKKYRIEEKEKEELQTKSINEAKMSEEYDNNKKKKNMKLNLNAHHKSEKNLISKLSGESNIKSEESEYNNDSQKEKTSPFNDQIYSPLNPKVNIFEFSEEKNKDIEDNTNKLGKSARFTIPKKFSLKGRKKTIKKKRSLVNISNLLPLKLFSGKNEKIKTDQIQNVETDSKILKSPVIQNVKEYKFKFPQETVNSNLIDKNQKEKNLDSLPRLLANDILNKEKFNYHQICKINMNPTNPSYLESDFSQRTKMMLLNKDNVDKITKQILVKIKKRNYFEKLNKRYDTYKHNLLSMRQSLSNDKRKEFETLANKIKLKKLDDFEFNYENENELTEIDNVKKNILFPYKLQRKSDKKNFSLMNALVNPKDNSNYSRFYLPRNGSMLLSRDGVK